VWNRPAVALSPLMGSTKSALPSALLPALLDVLAQISEVRQSLNEGYVREAQRAKLLLAEQTLFQWYKDLLNQASLSASTA
jgi:hypothetical protein